MNPSHSDHQRPNPEPDPLAALREALGNPRYYGRELKEREVQRGERLLRNTLAIHLAADTVAEGSKELLKQLWPKFSPAAQDMFLDRLARELIGQDRTRAVLEILIELPMDETASRKRSELLRVFYTRAFDRWRRR